MKTLSQIVLTAILLCTATIDSHAQKWGNKKVKGDGNVITKTITTQEYDVVDVTGSMDVTLITGTEGSVKVTTDSNLHEYITVATKGKTLYIKIENGISIRSQKGIKVTIPFTDLSGLDLVGSGTIESVAAISSENFEAQITGSGGIKVTINTQNFDAKVTGSGDLKVNGNVQNLEVKVTGSGTFNGKELIAENTEAYVSGSGEASVVANSSLKARVNGSGDITYSGAANKNDTKVLGSGSIKSM
ncbi:head GIN domain-containing protein [Cochleicola gelatinilyticus]|uniref:Putative auto-transporter adhesin head GIN domain-containing protein n=1 Tax=Cochleicola gelatinilyticus TaxID=1763537 RepID=A0A167H2V7_9FLAO|nr:head GIN domain-containing protein [Cochleicola gelatinilyticus]OAB78158.1 hypothetical protein ULVI_11795 [Cochleicola gelatinilyticus]